jgi:phosphoglycerate dehydrogenase-like enzyme
MTEQFQVLVHGVESVDEIPMIGDLADLARFRCAASLDRLRVELEQADILLGWNFRAADLERAWEHARRLRWIHWSGAGVDALLFPSLVRSDVIVTNARGAFDVPMAEYVLGLVIAMAKGFPETLRAQSERRWHYRTAERVQGKCALIVGAGSIGRAIARMLRGAGMSVSGVGRRERTRDADFGCVHAVDTLDRQLARADYVVLITPLTQRTRGLMGASRFAAMKPTARFINVGRGALVDEAALADALERGVIAGAALDVFRDEPLAAQSPLWSVPNLIVSPHMSGDTHDYREVVASQFADNLRRFGAGEPLRNVVDKSLGFVAG